MTSFLLVMIFIFSALSLVSYMYCWNDIKNGRPYILSLRQITMVMDRNRLNELFGEPQPGYFYQLEPHILYALIKNRQFFYYRECMADGLCAFGAWRFMTGDSTSLMLGLFIVLALVCQGINFLYSSILIRKWGHQIREEIDNSAD